MSIKMPCKLKFNLQGIFVFKLSMVKVDNQYIYFNS